MQTGDRKTGARRAGRRKSRKKAKYLVDKEKHAAKVDH
jgi:hypothetical protein